MLRDPIFSLPRACSLLSILEERTVTKLRPPTRSADAAAPAFFYSWTVARKTTWSEGIFVCESVSAVTKTLKVWNVVAVFKSPL